MNTDHSAAYRQELVEIIRSHYTGEYEITTPVESMKFYYRDAPSRILAALYKPSLCLVVQGAKEVELDDDRYRYDPYTYLLASVHLPAKIQVVKASKEEPYMGIVITFSTEQIFEVLKEVKVTSQASSRVKRGLCLGSMDIQLLEPILRLARLINNPDSIPMLAPMALKEILFYLLQNEGGEFIRQYVQDGSTTHCVVKAINQIKANFKETINMKHLAESVGISESTLYRNFKKVTSKSPLQFQKELRLHEAREMLLAMEINAAQVAFDVGYESPSQFNREYSRLFGLPPKADVKQYLNNGA